MLVNSEKEIILLIWYLASTAAVLQRKDRMTDHRDGEGQWGEEGKGRKLKVYILSFLLSPGQKPQHIASSSFPPSYSTSASNHRNNGILKYSQLNRFALSLLLPLKHRHRVSKGRNTLTRPIVSASAGQCSGDLGRHSFVYWSLFDG